MKKAYKDLTKNELLTVKAALEEEYKTMEAKGLNLNMARGKPGFSQLALSMPMLDVINSESDMRTVLGNDTRNYGDLDGIGECRRLMADMMGVQKDNVVVCGIASEYCVLETLKEVVRLSKAIGFNVSVFLDGVACIENHDVLLEYMKAEGIKEYK